MPSVPDWWGSKGPAASAAGPALGALGGRSPALDDPAGIRTAGSGLLSLALLDARNRLLQLLAQQPTPAARCLAVRAGHYQERWIGCHLQRQRGEACDLQAPRLAGVEPRVGAWLTAGGPVPDEATVRNYLAQTLDITLDLLASTPEADAPLHFFRMSLWHEDRLCETLAERNPASAPPPRAARAPLLLPARRWMLGTEPGTPGLVPHPERWGHPVQVPAFEIDAQPVNWAQFAEFAEDGGYDRAELWTEAGWAWVQASGRRAPRGVLQWHGGALRQRLAEAEPQPAAPAAPGLLPQRVPLQQAVMHVSRHEAQAWCHWAGRRLPTEPEWELAACTGAGLGFVWGDVFEWVAGSARPWPGGDEPRRPPGGLDPLPLPGTQGVLRGASFATSARWRHPKARRWMAPEQDRAFCGFRSCAP